MSARRAPARTRPKRPALPPPSVVDPKLVAHIGAAYDCARDGTSVYGLAAIRKKWPRHWAAILRACLPADAPVTPGVTLEEYLRAGAGGLLLPRDERDANLKLRRTCARLLVKVFRDVALAGVTDDRLEAGRERYWKLFRSRRSPKLISRDMTLLRQAVRRAQLALGVEAVAEKWQTPLPAAKKAPRRYAHDLHDISKLLAKLDREPDVRAVVALVVGAGLWEDEALDCADVDIDLQQRQVAIRDRCTRGWPEGSAARWVPIAAWAIPLLEDWLAARGRYPRGLPLFPNRADPRRPRTTVLRAIAGAAHRAELEEEEERRPPWTLQAMRWSWQAVARAAGLPRSAVRATRGPPDHPAEAHAADVAGYRAARKLADAWKRLVEPPVDPELLRRAVPRRSPKNVSSARPEPLHPRVGAPGRGRRSWPLPTSCGERPKKEEESWSGDGEIDSFPEAREVTRARCAPPAARAARTAAPAPPAVMGAADLEDESVEEIAVTPPIAVAPATPPPEVVVVTEKDGAAQTQAAVAGAILGGVVGFFGGLGAGSKEPPPGEPAQEYPRTAGPKQRPAPASVARRRSGRKDPYGW